MNDEQRNPGDTYLFGHAETCETDGCKNKTKAAIWVDGRWRYTCDEHYSAVQREARGL